MIKKLAFLFLVGVLSCSKGDDDVVSYPEHFVYKESVGSAQYQGYVGLDSTLTKIDLTGTRFEELSDTIIHYLHSNEHADDVLYDYGFREFTFLDEEQVEFVMEDLGTTVTTSYSKVGEDFFGLDDTDIPIIEFYFCSDHPDDDQYKVLPGVFYLIDRYDDGREIDLSEIYIDPKVELNNFDENKLQADYPIIMNDRDTLVVYYFELLFEKQ